jgi:2-oxoisovalerate dehydrogenase E2 component (dihydrolipoyl transacylase)
MAEAHGLDLASLAGTGAHGRVTRRDVEDAIASGTARLVAPDEAAAAPATATAAPASAATNPPAPPPPGPASAPPSGSALPQSAVPLSPMRRAIAAHLSRARAEIPDAWSMVEIDVTRLDAHRASLQPTWQAREGYELTYLPFFVKAVVAGLRAVPELNATLVGDSLILHRQYDLGIAVSVPGGLVVPVLRHADDLSVAGLARALRDLIVRARAGRLQAAELQGATFTVNNPGALGSILTQPIVPLGQAGIVTMEAIVRRPVVVAGDAIAIRSMMNSALSFDHRIVDGAAALLFLRALKAELETVDYPLF